MSIETVASELKVAEASIKAVEGTVSRMVDTTEMANEITQKYNDMVLNEVPLCKELSSGIREILSDYEKVCIKLKQGWSDEIINSISSWEQYEIYKDAGLAERLKKTDSHHESSLKIKNPLVRDEVNTMEQKLDAIYKVIDDYIGHLKKISEYPDTIEWNIENWRVTSPYERYTEDAELGELNKDKETLIKE